MKDSNVKTSYEDNTADMRSQVSESTFASKDDDQNDSDQDELSACLHII